MSTGTSGDVRILADTARDQVDMLSQLFQDNELGNTYWYVAADETVPVETQLIYVYDAVEVSLGVADGSKHSDEYEEDQARTTETETET